MEMGRALALGIFEYYGLSLPPTPAPLQSTFYMAGPGSGSGATSQSGTSQQRAAGTAGVSPSQQAVRNGGGTSLTRGALSEAASGLARMASAKAALTPSAAPSRTPSQTSGGSFRSGSSVGGGRGSGGGSSSSVGDKAGGGGRAPSLQLQQQQSAPRRYTSSPLEVRRGGGGGRGEEAAGDAGGGTGPLLVVNGNRAASKGLGSGNGINSRRAGAGGGT